MGSVAPRYFSLIGALTIASAAMLFTHHPGDRAIEGHEALEVGTVLGIIDAWAEVGCDFYCTSKACEWPDQEHEITIVPPGGEGNAEADHIHDCTVFGSCEKHACSNVAFGEEYERVRSMLTRLDGPALVTLVTHSEDVAIHPARRALQVAGCDENILLSLPLTEVQAQAVTLD